MLDMLVLMRMKAPPPRLFLSLRYVVYSVGKHSLLRIYGVSYDSVSITTSGLVLSKRFMNWGTFPGRLWQFTFNMRRGSYILDFDRMALGL